MYLRTILNSLLALLLASHAAAAQEHPARRLSTIVGVAVEEYAKGIDSHGALISQQEYDETVGFLADARSVAERLSGDRANSARAVFDTLVRAVDTREPPAAVAEIHRRFVAALGDEGALELPPRAPSVARGGTIYAANCAQCHGARGMGDGPLAPSIHPAPPAIGSDTAMASASPALQYRVMTIGVPGTKMPAWSPALSVQDRWDVVAYLQSLRTAPAATISGEGLYLQRCASCHGPTGAADGALSRSLSKLPPDVGSLAWQAEQSDSQLAKVVRHGAPGTAMPPARDLTEGEVGAVVAYLRSLPERRSAPDGTAPDSDAAQVARNVMATLDQALVEAQAGRTEEATERAVDAYIAFEPLETPTRAKRPGLVSSMEQHFADFKASIKANDIRAAQQSRDAIETSIGSVVELTRQASGAWSAFFESFLIILREGFEAILVIGAVATFLTKTGNGERVRSVWVGAGLGVAASILTAVVLQTLLAAVPATRDLIEGITMLVAVAVLFSVSYWLISKVDAARWQQFIRDKVSSALEHGGGTALAFVAFLAVYREGAETALFFQALFAESRGLTLALLGGIVVGFAALTVIFILFHRFGVRLPLRPFFAATSVLLYYMAFVFVGKGIHELQEVNAVPMTVIHGLPQVEALGIFPTVETIGAQLVLVLLFIGALVKTFWPKRAVTLPTVPPTAAPTRPTELSDSLVRLEERVERLEREADKTALTRADVHIDVRE